MFDDTGISLVNHSFQGWLPCVIVYGRALPPCMYCSCKGFTATQHHLTQCDVTVVGGTVLVSLVYLYNTFISNTLVIYLLYI